MSFLTEFIPELNVEHMTNAQAKTRYSYLIDSKYSNLLTIFMDGSKITLPELSVSAAVASLPLNM